MKQNMKRTLFVLISMIIMGGVNAVNVDGLRFSLSGAYASVTGVVSGNESETIIVPETFTYEGLVYTVNAVSSKAFFLDYTDWYQANKYVKEIILPKTITTIGQLAFRNEKITIVKLQEGLISIGDQAFVESAITEMIIPRTVQTMGSDVFTNCNKLRTLIYLGENPPSKWVATSQTYVPVKSKQYSSPYNSINNASIIEMITFHESSFIYTGEAPTPTWTNNVEGYTATLDLDVLNSSVGSHQVNIPATFTKGTESFTTEIPYSYTILPVTLRATPYSVGRAYGDPNPEFAISYSGFINDDDESVLIQKPIASTTATEKSGVGIYYITLSGGVAQNYTFQYVPGLLSITKAPLTATVKDATRLYGSPDPTFSFSYTGLKNNETVPSWEKAPVFSTSATQASNIGIYSVTAECLANNYDVTIFPGTLTITPASLTIKANNAERLYFEDDPSFTYTCIGFKNNETSAVLTKEPTMIVEADKTSDVGSYAITPSGASAQNYDITYENGLLNIGKRTLSVQPTPQNREYGENNPDFTFNYEGFVNEENEDVLLSKPTASTTADQTSAVGSYPITANGGEAKNYLFEYVQGNLTISKAPLSIKVNDTEKVYGKNNPEFKLTYTGLKNNEESPAWASSPKFTTTATKTSDVGTYEVYVECDPKNYYITSNESGSLTINKAPLTIKANNQSMLYHDAMPEYTFIYNGFVNSDNANVLIKTPSVVTDANTASNVGTYTITPTGAEAKNYAIAYEPGTLTINPRTLLVKANSASRLYGENNPKFTLTYEGFVANETKDVLEQEPQTSTTATPMSNVGTYDIKVSGGKATNYTFTYQGGLLSIEPRDLLASVGNYERAYGEENPAFTIVYDGLASNDTESSLNVKPMVRTNATRTSDVGEYNLDVTGGYSPNYTLSYKSGKLTIVKAEQTFEWNQDLSNVEAGAQIELTAQASSGLPVTYIMDENNYAEIYKAGSKTYMECKSAGTFSIKAVQEGNSNYYSTQRINKKVTIYGESDYEPTLIIKQADNGAISTKVAKGKTYTFTIHVENGWKIHSVMFNDVDMTDQLDNESTFTTPAIESTSTLSVAYESVQESRIDEVRFSDIKIMPTSYGAKVTGTENGDLIQVYETDGVLQKSITAEGQQTDIQLSKGSVYIVKVGAKTVKLSL